VAFGWYQERVINIKQIAAATAITAGLGLAGVGAASIAEAQPAGPLPDYHWCPGQFYDPGWGNNWDWNRCHDDFYGDGDPHDRDHWHGQGDWRDDHDRGWDNGRGPGWDNGRGPGWDDHRGQGR
jgi:hypothetical protein